MYVMHKLTREHVPHAAGVIAKAEKKEGGTTSVGGPERWLR